MGKYFVLIFLVALFLRIEPYLYIKGGQDQGIYVNASAVYERGSSVFITDEIRLKLSDESKEVYDRYNQIAIDESNTDRKLHGKHLNGIFIHDLAESEYIFSFYPLHPLWMAIAGKIMGSERRVYSLTLFSIISIMSLSLLAYEISGRKKIPAYIVAIYLAVNPLHTYFSKFPVTEVVALAFTSSSFYCLVKYLNLIKLKRVDPFYLLLSSGLLFCFFMTRITGFLYLPFFLFVLMSIIINYHKSSIIKRQLLIYCVFVIVLWFISMLYGYTFSYPYFHKIFFKKIHLFTSFKNMLIPAVSTALLFLIAIFYKKVIRLKYKIFTHSYTILVSLFFLSLLVSLYRAYLFAFTESFINSGLHLRWGITGHGMKSMTYSIVTVFIQYLTPIGAIVFLVSLVHMKRVKNPYLTWLLFLLVLFWSEITFKKVAIQYQYYYARYLLSELIPYSFLFLGVYLGRLFTDGRIKKRLAYAITIAIVIISAFFTSFQFRGREALGFNRGMQQIDAAIDDDDLIILYSDDPDLYYLINNEIKVPLAYYHDLYLISTTDLNEVINGKLSVICRDFNTIYVLSPEMVSHEEIIETSTIAFNNGYFERVNRIPRKFINERRVLYLSRIKRENFLNNY